MTAGWASGYVGIPYRLHGRGRDGADCWGLAALVMRERFGIILPDFEYDRDDASAFAVLADSFMALNRYEKVLDPVVGDLALLRIFGRACHVGVVVGAPGERNLLHTLHRHDSVLDFYDRAWAGKLEGFYRAE